MEALQGFSYLDVLFFTILLVSLFYGVKSGVGSALITLASLVTGIALGWVYYWDLASIFIPYVQNETFAKVLAFVLILIACHVIGVLVELTLGGRLLSSPPGLMSRILGGLCNTAKGFLICFCIYVVVLQFLPALMEQAEGSVLAPAFERVYELLPEMAS